MSVVNTTSSPSTILFPKADCFLGEIFLIVMSTLRCATGCLALREKCPNMELFLVRIFLYSVRMQENTDHK